MTGNLVYELKVPDVDAPVYGQNGRVNPQYQEYRDLVASVVMDCPNLERLIGFYSFYGHEFDRLTHALSTRKKLKEKIWIISEHPEVSVRAQRMLPPGLLDPYQTFQFLHYHSDWSELETLMLLSAGGRGILEHNVFVDTINLLPSLKHLAISSFDADDFTDHTLLALPDLVSLRLENLPGITDTGLSRWVSTPAAQNIESLFLIHQNLTSLLAISKLFASLPSLLRFTLIQSQVAPSLPPELLIFQPLLASPSLRLLHWDIASHTSPPAQTRSFDFPPPPTSFAASQQTPNTHLALSIRHSGFPSLLSLRAPSDLDPTGALQAVCRPSPNGQILLPADRYSLPPSSRTTNGSILPASKLPTGNSLHMARLRAQNLIDVAAKGASEYIKVIVTDHSDREELDHALIAARYPSGRTNASSRYSTESYNTSSTSSGETERAAIEKELAFGDMNEGIVHPLQSLRMKLTRTVSTPIKVHEFSLPAFMGRVSTSAFPFAPKPPRFNLRPDIPGYDADGGIVGWADLLAKPGDAGSGGPPWIRDGCTGQWNRSHKAGPDWWRHTERERRGLFVESQMFF